MAKNGTINKTNFTDTAALRDASEPQGKGHPCDGTADGPGTAQYLRGQRGQLWKLHLLPVVSEMPDLPGMPEHEMPVQFLPDLPEHQPVQFEKLYLPDLGAV